MEIALTLQDIFFSKLRGKIVVVVTRGGGGLGVGVGGGGGVWVRVWVCGI